MINQNYKIYENNKYFPYFIVDNFIEDKNYDILKKEFYILLSRIDKWSEEYGVQFCDNKKLDKPILLCWGKSSPDSFDQILNLCDDLGIFKKFLLSLNNEKTFAPFFKFNKKIKIFKVNEKISLFDFITKINTRISIKISRSQPGSGMAIHRDSKDKILAMLLYFGFSDNIERDYGGTQIYKLNNQGENENVNHLNPNGLDHFYFSHKNFEKIADVEPLSNRLFGFVRNENSWHGVEPFEINDQKDVYRDTLQINLIKHRNYSFFLRILKKVKNTLQNFLKKN
jgi:hypothetical protein